MAEIKHRYPNLPVLARAYDQGHSYALQQAGADFIVKETYHSALAMGGEALKRLGYHPFRVEHLKTAFIQTERQSQPELYQSWKDSAADGRMNTNYLELFMQLEETLGEVMKRDRSDGHSRSERGWTPPPKDYANHIGKPARNKGTP